MLTRDGTADPVSRDQILRHVREQGDINFPCSADHEQDGQPFPVDPYSAICDDHTYIHTSNGLACLPARCQSKQIAKKSCAPLAIWSPRARGKDEQGVGNGADPVAPQARRCPGQASARSCGAKNLAARSRTRLL